MSKGPDMVAGKKDAKKQGWMKWRINGKGLLMIQCGYQREDSFLSDWLRNGMAESGRGMHLGQKRKHFAECRTDTSQQTCPAERRGRQSGWSLSRAAQKSLVGLCINKQSIHSFFFSMIHIRKLWGSSGFWKTKSLVEPQFPLL